MKRKVPLLLAVVGCALGVAAVDAAAQAKYNLRWVHYLADSPFVQLEKDFASEIEKRTNGQVKITITFAQGLGKTTELLTLTAKGAIDMTATAPGYNSDQLHYWRAFQLPRELSRRRRPSPAFRYCRTHCARTTSRRQSIGPYSFPSPP